MYTCTPMQYKRCFFDRDNGKEKERERKGRGIKGREKYGKEKIYVKLSMFVQ